MRLLCLILVSSFVACSNAPHELDWAGWRGPTSDGRSATGMLAPGAKIRLETAWQRPIGTGYSAVSVSGDTAVTMVSEDESDHVVAFAVATGDELWRHELGPTRKGVNGAEDGPLGSVHIADGTVYGLGPRGALFALGLEDGSEIWSLEIEASLGAKPPQYGFATTPLVVDEKLIVPCGSDDGQSIQALDRRTGRPVWAVGDDTVGYQSALMVTLAGERRLLMATLERLVSLDADTGRELGDFKHIAPAHDGYTQAVPVGDDGILMHYLSHSALFRIRPPDADTWAEEVWRSSEFARSLGTPVHHDGHLYGFTRGQLTCLDAADGTVMWQEEDSDGRTLIGVDGHIVVLSGDGTLVVAEASALGYREEARLRTPVVDSHTGPSFAGGLLFLRGPTHLSAVELTAD